MKSTKIIIAAATIAAIICAICLIVPKAEPPLDVDKIYEPSEETGFIAEKVIGNPEEAKLIIYEYADYACSHCADWNQIINNLIEKHDGKIAVVFRGYDLGLKNSLGFRNGTAAARAATAAQIQGYFKEMKDLLFSNQAEWFNAKETELNGLFSGYFKQASNGSGDIDKFIEDMASDSVETRLEFEQNLGKKAGLTGTPTFRINDRTIDLDKLVDTIEKRLN